MNPLASVACHPSDPSAYPDSFFVNFDVIVGTDLTPAQMRRLDTLARQRGKEGGREGGGFICALTFGLHAWAFIDLGESFTGRMDEAPGGGRTEGKNGEGGKAKVSARKEGGVGGGCEAQDSPSLHPLLLPSLPPSFPPSSSL